MEGHMLRKTEQAKLQDGTQVKHKVLGYEGFIEGTTAIKECFTAEGEPMNKPSSKQIFQYRVVIKGEPMRRIAPDEDLEILKIMEEVTCPQCHTAFRTKLDLVDKPGGCCSCGRWICPSCFCCQDERVTPPCPNQRKRLIRKRGPQKKVKRAS